MKQKILSLAMVPAVCLGLTVSAFAMEINNGKCAYELSNNPIGTIEIPYPMEENESKPITTYVVPDNTTVRLKDVPNGGMELSSYSFEQAEWLWGMDYIEPGETLTVAPVNAEYCVYKVAAETESGFLEDGIFGGLCAIAESDFKATGLTMTPFTSEAPAPETTSVSEASPSTGFADVAADAYYAAPVKWAVEKGITNGTGENQFSPDQTCTNAQILTFLWRAYGQPEPAISNPFTNSIPDAYMKAACWAYEKGMVSGTAFDVDGLCSRALAVTYMWQAAGSPAPAAAAAFSDVPTDAVFAAAVSWAVEKDVTAGTSDTTFSPNNTCTRGQIATFLYRALA